MSPPRHAWRKPSRIDARVLLAWLLCLAAALACGKGRPDPAASSEPPRVATSPEQGAATGKEPWTVERGGWSFTITPLATYTVRGRVLSTAGYWSGWQTELSPLDLAIGWGDLITSGAWEKVDWSQSNRWYWYRWGSDFGHDAPYIYTQSANTHILPANDAVEDGAETLSEGDDAELSGYLVRVDGKRGGRTVWWESSLSRDDTGDGSCEVLWLTRVRANGQVWE